MVLYAIDTETYKYNKEKDEYEPVLNTNEFTLGCVSHRNRDGNIVHYVFGNKEEMKEYIKKEIKKNAKQKRNCYFYGHWAQYDYYALYKENINEHKIFKLNPLMIKLDTNAFFLDTQSFYPYNLKELGKKVGLDKLEMPTNPKTINEIKPYLERDCEIVIIAMEKFKKDLEKIGMKTKAMFTAGQIAMSVFRTWIRKEKQGWSLTEQYEENGKIKSRIIPTKYDVLGRKAYKIGRNEAFQTGEYERLTYIDKNSLFPYAMTQIEMPDLRREYHMTNIQKHFKIEEFLMKYTGIAKAIVIIPEIQIGYLGIQYKDYLIFPNEKGKEIHGTFTIPELRRARELGYKIIEISEAVFYPKINKNPFKKYMEMMYKKRKEEPELSTTIKTLMNCVHGKMGIRLEREETMIANRSDSRKLEEEGWYIKGRAGEQYYFGRKIEGFKPSYANVIISALIVSKARDIMYNEYNKIPYEDLIYTDIDSIIFKGNHKDKFVIGDKLGEFKIEQENVPGNIIKEKIYTIGEVIKSGGINKKDLTVEKLKKETRFYNYEMITLPQAIQMNRPDLIGTFVQKEVNITERMKIQIETPDVIIENDYE